MWPQIAAKKARTDPPDRPRAIGAIPPDVEAEVQDLRRRLSELQAAAVREKRAEEVLRDSEERFRRVFEEGPLGMAMSDAYFRFTRANAALCLMLGYSEKELTTLTFKEITHPDYLNGDSEAMRKLLRGEIPVYRTEKRYLRKDKKTIWGAATIAAVRDAEGGFLHFLAMVEDISDRKQASHALALSEQEIRKLQENEENYRKVFELAHDAMFLMDTERFTSCNSSTLKIFGCAAKEDIVGHAPWEFSPPRQPDGRDSQEKARELIAAASGGQAQRFSWLHTRKDGTELAAEVSLTALVLSGKPVILAVVRDTTERTQAERLQNAVYRIAQAADESANLDDLYKSVHETVRTVMPAGNFYIALYDAVRDLISFPYFVDEVDSPPEPVRPGKGLTEYVIRTGRPLLCDEATDTELRGRGEVEVVGAPSAIWLGVPLIVDKKTIGAMVVQHYSDPKAYGQRELRMLEYVSSQVAKSIEYKRTEDALKKNEQRLSLHIRQTPLGAIEWDTGFRVLQWNPAAERIFGYPAAEAIGRHASFIIPAVFREHVDGIWQDLMAGRGGIRSTNENVTKDGRTIYCEWYNTPLKDGEGRTIGVASLVEDATEKRKAEEALRDSEELYRKLLSSIPDVIIRTDLEGNILFANDVAVRSGGFVSGADLAGRSIFSFVAPEDLERAKSGARAMFDTRIPPSECQLVFNGGKKALYEINGAVLRNQDQTPYGMVFLCRDIADRKQAETNLHQSVRQLRTTLKAAIDSLASAIEMRDPYTAGHQERVTRLATAIAREMKLGDERIEGIQIAGIIHDIGKLYVPAEILSKPTKLNELEYSMVKMHAQVGYTILSKIDFPWPIARIVHQHHEFVNGSGYPQGLAGKDILLEAKILCVADVVEAMSSHRPYRPALGLQAAIEEISQKRGILYDREVVDACLRLLSGKNFKFD
ncbi:MAG TPA: PAS domain S-box protein [Terriglobales bacterium]|nr:PAS domain S-box protein [Terriglobales bacterium]